MILALLLSASMLGNSQKLTFALYAFTGAADELTSVGKVERGMLKTREGRITAKVAITAMGTCLSHQASKSDRRWVRALGHVARWGVPMVWMYGTLNNFRVKTAR